MALNVREEHPLEAFDGIVARGERLLIASSVCPTDVNNSIKYYSGPNDELGLLFPELSKDLLSNRHPGPVYYMIMGTKYPNIGLLQISIRTPIVEVDHNVFPGSLSILTATLKDWPQTHLYLPLVLGGGLPAKQILKNYLEPYNLDLTLWVGDCRV